MHKEYQVVYDYNGYQLCVGNPVWIPDKEIAERVMRKKQNTPLFSDQKLYLISRENDDDLPELKTYNGKPVYEDPFLFWDGMEVGDYVTDDVAMDILDCVPPVSFNLHYIQLGEPYDAKIDDRDGRIRSTYLTLQQVDKDVWVFLGYCFRGEREERGENIPYVKGW